MREREAEIKRYTWIGDKPWVAISVPGRRGSIHLPAEDYELLCVAVIRDVLRRKPEMIFDSLVDQEPEP